MRLIVGFLLDIVGDDYSGCLKEVGRLETRLLLCRHCCIVIVLELFS